ncbi:MAG: glycogen/starch synthase [Clostridiales bacterium]|nr:glycogen/starch synthase [Clostridiales bacterium]
MASKVNNTSKSSKTAAENKAEKKPAATKNTATKATDKKPTASKIATASKKPAAKKPAEASKPNAATAENKTAKKILFVTAEAFPFAGTGGLGEVAGSLPKALNNVGADCRVIMPLFGSIAEKYRQKMTYIGQTHVMVGWRNQYCGLFSLTNDGVTTYFVDNEYYFKRDGIYGHFDDGERWAFFCRAVLEAIPLVGFKPDVIHSNDHATALVPVYYKTEYASRYGYNGIKNVFTIHNLEYQGCYPSFILGDVFGIAEHDRWIVDFNWELNCVKGAIESADKVTTVSPTYAKEIQTPERGYGLHDILCRNAGKLSGILNGVNVEEYNPEKNTSIAKHYSAADTSGKTECKAALKKECGFEDDKPIVAVISRLAGHKGLDLVKGLLEREWLGRANIVILGTGEKYLEDFFAWYGGSHKSAKTFITYNKDLAHRIYSGADMFLMPSGSEPCGLSQMMACRYGTIPIVRRTGGLADSIHDCRSGGGNGFVFDDYTVEALCDTVNAAIDLYYKKEWKELMLRAMNCDFTWDRSAVEYMRLYE